MLLVCGMALGYFGVCISCGGSSLAAVFGCGPTVLDNANDSSSFFLLYSIFSSLGTTRVLMLLQVSIFPVEAGAIVPGDCSSLSCNLYSITFL